MSQVPAHSIILLAFVVAVSASGAYTPPLPAFKEEAVPLKVEGTGQSFAVAFADVDSDGDVDMFVTNSGSPNLLFINKDGSGNYDDATAASGLADATGASRGAVFADVNGDGFLDLYVTNAIASNHLYIGDGKGHFNDSTATSGVGDTGVGQAACFADVDGDGDLDLFVANFGQSDNLYLNDGKGIFANATTSAGLSSPGIAGFGCAFGDVDEDGDLDLYVTNAGSFNKLYINDGKGIFSDNTENAGVAATKGQGRGVSFADFNGDGHLDLFMVGPMMKNQLFLGDGSGQFTDGSDAAGVTSGVGASPLAQGVNVADVDGDGDIDIIVSNIVTPHILYQNNGKGHFTDVASSALHATKIWGQGIACGDLNHDGAIDIYMDSFGPDPKYCPGCTLNNSYLINKVDVLHWLKVRPVTENGFATLLGAEVRLFEADTKIRASVRQQIDGGSGFASQNAYDAYFGLGTSVARGVDQFDIEVRCGGPWITKVDNPALGGVKPNQIVTAKCATSKIIV
eukprot:TRINITY_DN45852_c0_g1_i1.p1 TRINITY_DN45852_c0_g1~~TRINITY_DN45852_c0_g1_i1.p1  ORF type:complete len:512 (+),score=68.03 TRINITY_DN45852_c0_g1_i1:65-1600(+)